MSSITTAATGATAANVTPPLPPSQIASAIQSQRPLCSVYIAAETNFDGKVTQVVDCFKQNNIQAGEKDAFLATHFVLENLCDKLNPI
jgi:hypothetical protein